MTWGLVKIDEPFTNLLCQGMVLNHIYSRRTDKGGIEYFLRRCAAHGWCSSLEVRR